MQQGQRVPNKLHTLFIRILPDLYNICHVFVYVEKMTAHLGFTHIVQGYGIIILAVFNKDCLTFLVKAISCLCHCWTIRRSKQPIHAQKQIATLPRMFWTN